MLLLAGILATSAFAAEEYFEKGKLCLTATDHDGWASLETDVYKWNDENRKWDRVVNDQYTRDGRCDYSLSPGVYQLRMWYRESSPVEYRTIDGIQIADKAVVEKQEYFEKGKLRLTATDHDGWASLETDVYRWNDESRKWDRVVNDQYTRDGRCDYSLSPGVYQLRMWYREANPVEARTKERIRIHDRQTVSIGEQFKGGNLPPIISASGPFEIGDGDGYYEMNERALFRLDIRDTDLASIEFLINDKVVRTATAEGRYEQTLKLSMPGEYRFAVRAKDANGTLETYGRTIPVSMQKDRRPNRAKHLPSDYGHKRVVMKCPQCKNEHPNGTKFCPEDGARLNPFERVVHGVLDASLINAGIDPRTPEAKHAKELGLDWLNPFSSKEEIDEGIQRLVDDVMKK